MVMQKNIMKQLVLSLILICFVQNGYGQSFSFAKQLAKHYTSFKEQSIQQRRFTESDIEPLIQRLASSPVFKVTTAGHSVEGRPIHLIRIGKGPKKVLFWSQMHGDESTATMALLDIFNFFNRDNDRFAAKRKSLLNKVSLYFLPMLNPDGAQKFQRRDALGIDINRDALRLTTPEAKILKGVRDSLNPKFGFNLHDESIYNGVGRSSEPATISLLAPTYDFKHSVNGVRKRMMRLIGYMNEMLQKYIPGKVARYTATHMPTAFGDNMTKWGTSSILIESGGYPNDPEKQYIRKMNFLAMMTAINGIANNKYSQKSLDSYYDIPINHSSFTDLLVKGVNMVRNGHEYLIDIGIRRYRHIVDSTSFYRATIHDVGDLSTTMHGYDELQGDKMKAYPGKVYSDTLENMEEVQKLDFIKLLRQGYTGVVVNDAPAKTYLQDIPLNIIAEKNHSNNISLGSIPNLYLKKEGKIRYVIVNGYVYNTEDNQTSSIKNTLVIK
jgi:hypothetical protein